MAMLLKLRSEDILVLLALSRVADRWTYASVAESLGLNPAEVHRALRRCAASGLFDLADRRLNRTGLLEFLVHGCRYVLWPQRGRVTRGIPTAHAAPPLAALIAQPADPPPVWPDPQGTVRGEAFEPLHRAAPQAARRDPGLYELLALVDAVRGGRARERKLAEDELRARLLA
jgi:hypothetical protein